MQVQLVIADPTGALRNHGRGGVLQRKQMRVAVHNQRRWLPREGGSQLQCVDGHLGDVSTRDGEVTRLLFGFAHGCALDVQTRDAHALHLNVASQQCERRPSQGDVLRDQPDALVIAELQALEIERGRERSGELRELYMTVGEPRGEPLDEPAACIGVAGNEHGAEQQHHQQSETSERPRRDFQGATHQKACPSPM